MKRRHGSSGVAVKWMLLLLRMRRVLRVKLLRRQLLLREIWLLLIRLILRCLVIVLLEVLRMLLYGLLREEDGRLRRTVGAVVGSGCVRCEQRSEPR